MEFNGNSNASRQNKVNAEIPEEKGITPITDHVKIRKSSEFKKFTKQFISEDISSVKGHIISDVVIPSIQKLVSDLIRNTVDGIIYGVRGIKSDSPGMRNIYNYNKAGLSYYSGGVPLNQIPQSQYARGINYSVNDVEFADRGDAEEVLYALRDSIERYGLVSIGDFYDMISQKHTHTDLKYGWRDLRDAEVVRMRGAFQIKFPKIVPLD